MCSSCLTEWGIASDTFLRQIFADARRGIGGNTGHQIQHRTLLEGEKFKNSSFWRYHRLSFNISVQPPRRKRPRGNTGDANKWPSCGEVLMWANRNTTCSGLALHGASKNCPCVVLDNLWWFAIRYNANKVMFTLTSECSVCMRKIWNINRTFIYLSVLF